VSDVEFGLFEVIVSFVGVVGGVRLMVLLMSMRVDNGVSGICMILLFVVNVLLIVFLML